MYNQLFSSYLSYLHTKTPFHHSSLLVTLQLFTTKQTVFQCIAFSLLPSRHFLQPCLFISSQFLWDLCHQLEIFFPQLWVSGPMPKRLALAETLSFPQPAPPILLRYFTTIGEFLTFLPKMMPTSILPRDMYLRATGSFRWSYR